MGFLDVDQARVRILTQTRCGHSQRVALREAGGRVLAQDVVARLTQPPFHASAMDGYGVKAADVSEAGVTLHIIGEAAAGRLYDGVVEKGQAVRIFTGAPIPRGVDRVVIQEDTILLEENLVHINKAQGTNKNIRPLGGDFQAGEILLIAGHLMTPAALALCAAAGHAELDVMARPRVALLSTGDELVEAGHLPKAGQIIASNAHALAEIIRIHGGEVINLGIVPDDTQAIKQAIETAHAGRADILLTSGGVSVGDYDLVQQVMREEGMQLDFWKIAMRPGKPLMFGRMLKQFPKSVKRFSDKNCGKNKELERSTEPSEIKTALASDQEKDILVLGVPGNPVSSIVTAHLFLVPMLEKMAGKQPNLTLHEAILTAPLGKNGPRRHYIRAQMTYGENGERMVTPNPSFDSSLLSVLAQANCLIVVPENNPEQAQGTRCQIFIPQGGL